jgi:hypothetical protein
MSQEYIKSRFGKMATADDVLRGVDLKGKIAVVTGATAGIGKATAAALARAGAEIVIGRCLCSAVERTACMGFATELIDQIGFLFWEKGRP